MSLLPLALSAAQSPCSPSAVGAPQGSPARKSWEASQRSNRPLPPCRRLSRRSKTAASPGFSPCLALVCRLVSRAPRALAGGARRAERKESAKWCAPSRNASDVAAEAATHKTSTARRKSRSAKCHTMQSKIARKSLKTNKSDPCKVTHKFEVCRERQSPDWRFSARERAQIRVSAVASSSARSRTESRRTIFSSIRTRLLAAK